jgi:hypothetical protein
MLRERTSFCAKWPDRRTAGSLTRSGETRLSGLSSVDERCSSVKPGAPLVVGANDVPWRLLRVSCLEHYVARFLIIVPALIGFDVRRTQFPLSKRINVFAAKANEEMQFEKVHFARTRSLAAQLPFGADSGAVQESPHADRSTKRLKWRRCRSPNTTTWSRHYRRIEPISRSACPFCHGDCGAVGRSRMPIERTRRAKTSP